MGLPGIFIGIAAATGTVGRSDEPTARNVSRAGDIQEHQRVNDTNTVCGGAQPLPVPVPAHDAPALPGAME